MGWDSKTFAAAAVACSSTATEAVPDHSTCPGRHSPALHSRRVHFGGGMLMEGRGLCCVFRSGGLEQVMELVLVCWLPRFYCRQGNIFLLFKGAWGEILSDVGLLELLT